MPDSRTADPDMAAGLCQPSHAGLCPNGRHLGPPLGETFSCCPPDSLRCPPAPPPPGPHPFPGNPALSQPQEPAMTLGHLNGRRSGNTPSHSSPQALYGTAHPTTAFPCLIPTSCLQGQMQSSSAGGFLPLLSSKYCLHLRTTTSASAPVPHSHHVAAAPPPQGPPGEAAVDSPFLTRLFFTSPSHWAVASCGSPLPPSQSPAAGQASRRHGGEMAAAAWRVSEAR